ncbi:MAG: hypothetical protein M3P44_17295 [Actinomycetota bacterium]|nr:hypothetical protein [Actinomycetota bacterium]
MRAVGVFGIVLAGAVATARLAAQDRWLGDQPGLVVIAYVLVAFVAVSICADARSPRNRAINAARRQRAEHRRGDTDQPPSRASISRAAGAEAPTARSPADR